MCTINTINCTYNITVNIMEKSRFNVNYIIEFISLILDFIVYTIGIQSTFESISDDIFHDLNKSLDDASDEDLLQQYPIFPLSIVFAISILLGIYINISSDNTNKSN